MAVKKYKLTEAQKRQQAIGIFAQVKTPDGIGIVVEIGKLDPNGLYFLPERLEYLVWYGVENEHTEWPGHGKRIAQWYKADELEVI